MTASTTRQLYLASRGQLELGLKECLERLKPRGDLSPLPVVVDHNLTGVHLRRRLAWQGCGAINLRFYTFADVARALGEQQLLFSRGPLPFFGKERFHQKMAAHLSPDSYFSSVASYEGFQKALGRSFEEMRGEGWQQVPENIEKARRSSLAPLYRRYLEALQPYYDQVELYREASKVTASQLPWSAFIIFGVWRFYGMQKKLLERICSIIPTYVFVPQIITSQPCGEEVVNWLVSQGFKVEREVEEKEKVRRGNGAQGQGENKTPNPNHFLDSSPWAKGKEGNSFSLHQEGSQQDNSLFQIYSLSEEGTEIKQLTRKVLELAQQGYYFKDMGVILPDAGYTYMLRDMFSSLSIPFNLPTGFPLEKTPPGRSFLLCLRLLGSNWPRREVMELLNAAPWNWSFLTGSNQESSVAWWDFLTLEARVNAGIDQWMENLTRLEGQYERRRQEKEKLSPEELSDEPLPPYELYQEHLRSLRHGVKNLHSHIEKLPSQLSWEELIDWAEALIVNFFREGEDREALLRQVGLLKSLGRMEEEVELFQGIELLRRVVKEGSIADNRYPHQGVTLVPLRAALGHAFRVLFLPGMLEQFYPTSFQQDPLFLEEERKKTRGFPLRREELQHQELQFQMVLETAADKIILSYPRYQGVTGRELVPSPYLLPLAEKLAGERVSWNHLEETPGFYRISSAELSEVEEAITQEEFDFRVFQKLGREEVPFYFKQFIPWFSEVVKRQQSQENSELTLYDGVLQDECSRQIINQNFNPVGRAISATALKSYVQCPYRFYLERMLQLEPLEEPQERLRIESRDRGNLIHRILEKFFREAQGHKLLPLTVASWPEAQGLLEEIAQNCFLEMEKEGLTGYQLLWELDKERIRKELSAYLEKEARQDPRREPCGLEKSFGYGDSPRVSMELTPEGERLFFKGRIDRLDKEPGPRLRVTDYKTGKVKISSRHLQQKYSLQLSVYLLAAKAFYPDIPWGEISAGYRYLDQESGFPEAVLSGSALAEGMDGLKNILREIIGAIASGYFFPYPQNFCSSCPYQLVCGPDISREISGKKSHSQFQKLAEIKESLTDE